MPRRNAVKFLKTRIYRTNQDEREEANMKEKRRIRGIMPMTTTAQGGKTKNTTGG